MKLDKKQLIIFIFVPVFVLVLASAIYFIYQKQKIITEEETTKKEKIAIEKQMEELEALRQQAGEKIPTEKELEVQKKELEKLKNESNFQAPSEEEIQKQLEELNKLRQ